MIVSETYGMPQVDVGGPFKSASPTVLIVEEHANQPSRFEISYPDPEFQLWAESKDVVGTEVSIAIDDGDSFKGKCWGRRVLNGHDRGSGTTISIWGYDDSFKLAQPPRLRAFEKGNLESCLKTICNEANISLSLSHSLSGRFASSESQFVQYDETNLEFLSRLAFLTGAYFWPSRGKLFFGKGPGDGGTLQLDLTDGESSVVAIQLNEDWSSSTFGGHFPRIGAPFPSGPKLTEQDSPPTSYDGDQSETATRLLLSLIHI